MITATDITVGDSISYKLREIDNPTDPDREWKGQVLSIAPKTDRRAFLAIVVSLEPGYEGLQETVHLEQITRIEKKRE